MRQKSGGKYRRIKGQVAGIWANSSCLAFGKFNLILNEKNCLENRLEKKNTIFFFAFHSKPSMLLLLSGRKLKRKMLGARNNTTYIMLSGISSLSFLDGKD